MRIALVSEHASPLAAVDGSGSGGQNVHVAELARALGARGHQVTVYTRRDSATLQERVRMCRGVTVEHVPAGPPVAGNETDTLLGALERQRAYLVWKCGGLDAAGTRATLGPSSITLGGLLKHLALVEDEYFVRRLHDRELGAPWDAVDWDADPDWEWRSAAADTPEQLMALGRDAVARARAGVAVAIADGGLDRPSRFTWPDGRTPSLRRLLIDVIEEYARHVGHADLSRESIDGLVGEDPQD